jgi:uncharacterized protein
MAQDLQDLPLFPLNTVLFPHATIRLHVFEERYRLMVQECVDLDKPFGVVLIRSGVEVGGDVEPYLVGTAARIVEVQSYGDGRMDIQVRGEGRFRIREFDESRPFLVGRVESVAEHPLDEAPQSQELVARARDEFEMLVQLMFSRQDFAVQVVFPADPATLSFAIANHLQMDNLEKQRLLEMTDTVERFTELLPIIESLLLDNEPVQGKPQPLHSEDLSHWVSPN